MTVFLVTCAFSENATISDGVELDGGLPVALVIPPNWTEGTLAFDAELFGEAVPDSEWSRVASDPVLAQPQTWIPLECDLSGAAYLRLESSVPQQNACTVVVVCKA